MNKTVILFSSFPDFSGNAKALYEYMIKSYKNKMRLSWVIYDKKSIPFLKELDIDFVLYGTKSFYKLIEITNMIFDTHNLLLNDKKEGQFYVNIIHGSGPKKTGYLLNDHQLAVQDKKYNYLTSTRVDYTVVPSEICRIIYSASFNYDITRILPLGMSRCDYLFSTDGKNNLKTILNCDVLKFKKIIMYLPTFRKGINRLNDGNFNNNLLNLELYDEKRLLSYLVKNNYLLIIKLHPSEETSIAKVSHANIIYLKEQNHIKYNISLYEYLNAVDLLITDYSSVYLEYLLLNKPVLFIHTDINKYQHNRGFVFENMDFWFPGPRIIIIDNFIDETDKLLVNKKYYSEERKNLSNLMFRGITNCSSKRICDFFFNKEKISNRCSLKVNIEYKYQKQINLIQDKHTETLTILDKFKNECYIKNQELKNIYNSKLWKLLIKIRKLKGKLLFINYKK